MRAALAVLLLPLAALADGGKPLAVFHAAAGFIDDAFAVSPDGLRLAYIVTDGLKRCELHLATLDGERPERVTDCGEPTVQRIEFLDADRLLLVTRPADATRVSAQVHGPKGAGRERLGPVDGLALGTVGGAPAVVTYLRDKGPKGTTHTVAAFRRDDLRPLGKRAWVEGTDGKVALGKTRLQPLFFVDGFTTLVALGEGGYDKTQDVRKPALRARYEALTGKPLGERDADDRIGLARLTGWRQAHPGASTIATFTDDLQRLFVVDGDDRLIEVQPTRPLRKYDPQSLTHVAPSPDALVFSLTVDPVNRDAVAAKKTDPDVLEIYRLAPRDEARVKAVPPDDHKPAVALKASPVEIARFAANKRPLRWAIGGSRIALLRKSAGFARGGADLEVHETAAR